MWTFILAYQDFCLSAFLPIIIFATCKSDFRFPFYFLADFLAIFLPSFSKILSSENQKPNTKSLPKPENQTKCCKTIFQKSAESQKCSNNKKHLPKAKNETESFLDISDKILCKGLLKDLKLSALEQSWLFGFSLLLADFWKMVLQFLEGFLAGFW